MSCVVAYKSDDGTLYFGGDSIGINGSDYTIRKDSKVFIKDGIVFGFVGSFRIGQILRSVFKIPKQKDEQSDYDYLCSTFIDSLTKCLKSKGFDPGDKNELNELEFLIGYRGKIYHIMCDFQVAIHSMDYMAIGAGKDFALGCLWASSGSNFDVEDKVRSALECSASFNSAVKPPFEIIKVKKSKKQTD
jgi:20S proteasome alpha/beta subunit